MSNYSEEVPQAKEEIEDEPSIASFPSQARLAPYSCSTEQPILRRSPRKPRPQKFDYLLLESDEEVVKDEETTGTSKSEVATNYIKRKKGDLSASGPSAKRKKLKRGYAKPELYAHLNELPDILAHELDVMFCGINPGQYSATVGHHFASPRNHFWRCLHDAGFTGNELVPAYNDHTLPKLFSLGLTNLVHRPTAEQNELSDKELRAGVPAFLLEVAKYRPYVVCFVGLGIAKIVKAHCLPKSAESKKTTSVGFQPFKLVHTKDQELSVHETLFYAIPSTSGRVVQFQREDKAMLLKELKMKLIDIKTGQFDTKYMHPVGAHVPMV